MKHMSAAEIRQKFLDFFVSKGHRVEPSAPLIPIDDASLLWINSGVATLKKYFDGRVIPENPRITNSQKSIRTNDIENVGKTARHHTFFEMLGNFSIGDYFKEEAIVWAWEFLTSPEWIGFDPEKLSITIHPEDDEAYEIWNKKVGVPDERIVRLEGNFWDIGEGPCGPNSEIFYDRGEKYGNDASDPELYPGGENERYLEIWNLVFSQYNHNPDGSYTPLPKKNIDTGMGLERMASVIQDVENNFETDLLFPIIKATCDIAGVKYGESQEKDVALKVIADHSRTVVFAIGDGALPSNEGRGYVIRRLLRRAVRYGKVLGIDKSFLYTLTPVVGEIMKAYYPEVLEKREFIERVIRNEEERFHETLNEGLHILEQMVQAAKKAGQTQIGGPEAFKLYDTYGFPFDLTEDFAAEQGMTVDREGFDTAMEEQRARARAARHDEDSMQVQGGVLGDIKVKSEFVGYKELATSARVVAIVHEKESVDMIGAGTECQIILDRTPFYAESGGQVADKGLLSAGQTQARVQDTQKGPNGQNVHTIFVESGTLKVGDTVEAIVDRASRADIIKNHTATHLLHQALKDVLGTHVNQAGSLVAPDRLRFDFSHFGAVTADELEEIERKVNEQVWRNIEVNIMHKSLSEAKAMGAMALFGEKYGDEVRVVQVGDYSLELCGGCHVNNTAEIGLFKILSEAGIGAGTRRIEAATGRMAYEYLNAQLHTLKSVADELKTTIINVPQRIEALKGEMKGLERENESLRAKLSNLEASSLTEQVKEIKGVKVLAAKVNGVDMDNLRNMVDDLKTKLGSGIVVLGSVKDDKVNIVAGVTSDLVQKGLHAGKAVKEVAVRCGGGGGGRPDMAQAGGKNPAQLAEALEFVKSWVQEQI
ncbi:alanine--tRNA ligase [Aneurinibacillus aneurinilyticus]|uniref:Alanine--tRNA ligase n=1 Tax=Aneurinibacillus aneurinilyticus ATCC 12856 TaxID=649747 RepID=U1YM31_ANEAE|nr:alanine--tRNA ligase [Aneurinibacillus aneurinilyticus]ERI11836.1 alanine--tRNA ligase [Aneurinibacillus aneurinilyticus ATCC 12856]MED0705301.1 alanine--tRNA ligase [Aneurinibacillus aneurinilyticus]MED0722451.1 alanine--tRNA ligase [Aneurinibacillus aneurinilyticus]MED0733761.1 alanine--tRNA ligase [Aneurinibacillus aneurinilyticus]MED0739718.1 alanine--tRNA ligase [Aneurinibacillus aneurinilyticus]